MNKKQWAFLAFLSVPTLLMILQMTAASFGVVGVAELLSSAELKTVLTYLMILVNIVAVPVIAAYMRFTGDIFDRGVTLKSLEADEHTRIEEARG